jgi:hypothetical protein
MKKSFLYISVLALVSFACTKSQFSTPTYSTGKANFTTFISVGNSLTQGYMDGGLYYYGQTHSYPSIIAQQINLVTHINFQQPLVTANGSGYIHLVYLNGQITPIQPGDDSTAGPNPCDADPSWANWGTNLQGNSYNNLGIAGILLTNCVALNPTQLLANNVLTGYQVISALSPDPLGNPFGRYLNFGAAFTNPLEYLNFIKASKATFFTCWLGNNDVLGYASSGGVVQILSTPLGNVAENDITPPAEFAQKYDSVLFAFHSMGAQGVCATIPDVVTIPYFTTVPSYVMVNGAKQYLWITTAAGVRQATTSDYIILPEYNAVLAGQGVYESNPIPNNMVLDASEVDSVEIATSAYNASIKSIAASFNYPVVDMNAFFSTALKTSVTIDGISLSRQYIEGGGFGLDGIHPTALGYALIANQFITQINATYGSTIPPVAESNYRGVLFPNF